MSKALSLHIGLNVIDINTYGTDGKLENCLNDCDDMAAIASQHGYTSVILKDAAATCARVTAEISRACSQLTSGDTFLVTYAGHGSQIADSLGEETDGMNETWVLYDKQLMDNELFRLWSLFAEGVNIFVISDSCHSGTMMRHFMMKVREQAGLPSKISTMNNMDQRAFLPSDRNRMLDAIREVKEVQRDAFETGSKTRLLSLAFSAENYFKHKDEYDTRSIIAGKKRADEIAATLIYISGCQDNQTSGDGPAGTNGLFTGKLLEVWNSGNYNGSYKRFHSEILGKMPANQSPNYMTLGKNVPTMEERKPFVPAGSTSSSAANTTVSPVSVSGQPSLQITSPWNRANGAPKFNVEKAGNPLFYIELATDAKLFDRAANDANRKDENFYASYKDPQTFENGKFLMSGNTFQLPDDKWDKLSAASRIYYRIGSCSDYSWGNFKLSCSDSNCFAAPYFECITNQAPVPQPTPENPTLEPLQGSGLSAGVGTGQPNKKSDVKLIQSLLNKVPEAEGGPKPKLMEDGLIGTKTLNAIQGFQFFFGLEASDTLKVVLPNSKTFQELSNFAQRSVLRKRKISYNGK